MAVDVGELIQRVQAHIFRRRVRVKDFFVDYDPLRSGRVTKEQFVRCVALMFDPLIGFQPAEADALASFFTEHGPHVTKPQDVSYANFAERAEEVFTNAGLVNDPTAEVQKPGALLPPSFAPKLTGDEDALMSVLHRVALMARTRGVVLKYCFQDFERSDSTSLTVPRRSGKVTVAQFRRHFPFVKDFTEEEVNLLIERYTTDEGDMHYQALINDVSDLTANEEPVPFPQSPGETRTDDSMWQHLSLSVVDKVQAAVVMNRLRLREPFQDFDPLRKGVCTVSQLKTVFTVLQIKIGVDDFDQLVQEYTNDMGMFEYEAFSTRIDEAFTKKGLEKDPNARINMPDAGTTRAARRNRAAVEDAKQTKVAELEEKIRSRTKVRRILLRTAFQDHDRVRRGVVTRSQFSRAMDQLGFELNESQVDLLCAVYCDRGNHHEFNYIDFCASCDEKTEGELAAMQAVQAPYVPPQASKYFGANGQVRPMQC